MVHEKGEKLNLGDLTTKVTGELGVANKTEKGKASGTRGQKWIKQGTPRMLIGAVTDFNFAGGVGGGGWGWSL